MVTARRCALWLGCLIGTLAAPARAETERVRLVYRAEQGCPGQPAFVAEVGRRVPEPWLAGDSELARVLEVTLARDGAQSRGELVYVNARGQRTQRVLSAQSCRDLFSAMVLVSVLAIQSGLDDDEPTSAEPAAAPPQSSPAAPVSRPRSAPAAPRRSSAAGVRVGAAGRLIVAGAVGPEPALGVGSHAEIGPGSAAWTVRAGIATLTTGSVATGEGRRATFSLQYAELGFCPELASSRFALVVCGLFEAGFVSGRGEVSPPLVVRSEEAREPWLAAVLEPRLELRVEILTLHLAPALVLPFTREEFKFERPESLAHRVPGASWAAGAGVGVQFR